MSHVTAADAATYHADGVVLIRGLFAEHVETLRAGVARNMAEPGPYASTNDRKGETGLFFDDYCNWDRIPEFREVVRNPRVIDAAATLMGSQSVQLFHDHVLVKEPGTSMATPWHQDAPYYFVQGRQTISFWSPLDPVTSATLRCVAGSHLWPKDVVPTRWVSETAFFEGDYIPVPDPEAEAMRIVEFEMEPGDAVAFHFRTLHGARGNHSDARRRAFSLRLVGDDARYVRRPGPTSPPFPGHDMVEGQRLREDWFPRLR
ncbi:MAG: phytanoyl-CoA dioxygenase family protein [Tateyamaria sp.]|uniref:phytanoyl-CoA dioxygenase family protein n=1 Tax=Tateyamaria sp. TaxID=1929288 RepID=UPI00327D4585